MAQRRHLEGGGGEGGAEDQFASVSVLFHTGVTSPGAALSFYTVVDCHSVGIHTLILLSLLPFLSNDRVTPG